MGFGKPIPIESINGKPVFGFVIQPERFDELLKEIREEFGNDFVTAKKMLNNKLRVTFVLTSKEPGSKAKISQKLDRIADGLNIKRIAVSEIEPTEISFPS